jgi:hypothetical protein
MLLAIEATNTPRFHAEKGFFVDRPFVSDKRKAMMQNYTLS